jgi:hypothetical protein
MKKQINSNRFGNRRKIFKKTVENKSYAVINLQIAKAYPIILFFADSIMVTQSLYATRNTSGGKTEIL